MSLYRRGRIWWIELTAQSGRIRESAGTADKKAAWEYHEKRKGEIWRQDKLGESPPVTWGEAVAAWLEVKPRSDAEKYMIRALGVEPSETLPLTSRQLSNSIPNSSSGSWNRYLSLVKAIHSCVGTTVSGIKRRPTTPGRTRWLTAEEWQRLKPALQEESPLLHECADFTLQTGLRENNVLELEWPQVDLRRRVVWFHADQMKGGVPHGLPLNERACAILEARRGIHKRWVFGNPDYPLYKASNRAWYAALKKAKIKNFRWHDLRHTWASWHVMNGTRLERLQELGGWKTLQMVRRYAHLSTEHLAEDAARVKPVSLRYNAPKAGGRGTKTPTKGA